jgi:hypothetical protein
MKHFRFEAFLWKRYLADISILAGFVLIEKGLMIISPVVALIIGGLVLIGFGILISDKEKKIS